MIEKQDVKELNLFPDELKRRLRKRGIDLDEINVGWYGSNLKSMPEGVYDLLIFSRDIFEYQERKILTIKNVGRDVINALSALDNLTK